MDDREHLHALVDSLPEGALAEVQARTGTEAAEIS